MQIGDLRTCILVALACLALPSGVLAAEPLPLIGSQHTVAQTTIDTEHPAKPAPLDPASAAGPRLSPPSVGLTPTEDLPIEGLRALPKRAGPAENAEPSASTPMAEVRPNSSLPRDLSPLTMFLQADIVVKSVLIGLAFASVVTWTVWLYKTIELLTARARLKRNLRAIAHDASLAAASQTLENAKGPLRGLIDVAAMELHMSDDTLDANGIKDRIASRLERVENAAVRGMNKGTGVLATIGATAPFVGLFGTVWGIMNSFVGISKSQTTNLAVVAPGIAEALLATAVGLVAAIPAVIVYNWFSRGLGVYRALAGDASAEVLRLASRDLDRARARAVAHRHAQAAE
jgi:biopolymer transport protein ExbB